VFLDGVPITLPYDGQMDLSQLSVDQFQLIRVARGSVSPLYGVNTLGGGINLISGPTDPDVSFNLRLEASSHDQYFTNAGYHNHIGPLKYRLYGNYFKGNGFFLPDRFKPSDSENGSRRDNDAFEKLSAGIKVSYDLTDRHQIALNANWIYNGYDIPPNTKTRTVRYWRFPEWKKNVYSLNSRHLFSDKFIIRSVLFYDSYFNLLKSYDDGNYTTQLQRYAWNSVYDDYSFGFLLYPALKILDEGSSNVLLSYKEDVHREKFRDSGFDTYKMSSLTFGVEQDLRINPNHSIILGADINQLNPLQAGESALRESIWMLNTQLAYQYEIGAKTKIHFSVAKKGRYPTLKELYSERLGKTIPNQDLKSESALNTELGILQKTGFGHIQAILYYNSLKNLISSREFGDGNQQLQNIGKAILQGLEIDSRIELPDIRFLLSYTLLNAINLSRDRPSKHLPNRPSHRFSVLADWQIMGDFSTIFENIAVFDQYYENPNTLAWEKFDDYVLLNMRMLYSINKHVQVYLRINNLTDALYENDFGVPMPGREILSGMRLQL
jgi:iron complex outermembrane receptor protein